MHVLKTRFSRRSHVPTDRAGDYEADKTRDAYHQKLALLFQTLAERHRPPHPLPSPATLRSFLLSSGPKRVVLELARDCSGHGEGTCRSHAFLAAFHWLLSVLRLRRVGVYEDIRPLGDKPTDDRRGDEQGADVRSDSSDSSGASSEEEDDDGEVRQGGPRGGKGGESAVSGNPALPRCFKSTDKVLAPALQRFLVARMR